MPECIYCGRDAGEYDEHELCVQQSMALAAMIPEDDPCVFCGEPMSWHTRWDFTMACVVRAPAEAGTQT